MNKNLSAALAIVLFGAALSANAALHDRGNGLIFDDTKNITWLKDANLANTNDFGISTRYGANQGQSGVLQGGSYAGIIEPWALIPWLNAVNSNNYLGYNNWRLAQADAACSSLYSCTNSEMGNLFYNELGGKQGTSILGVHNSNFDLFANIQDGVYYTNVVNVGGTLTYDNNLPNFDMHTGGQATYSSGVGWNAWLVIDGDVAAPVPEPETYTMLLAGLGLMGFMAGRRGKL